MASSSDTAAVRQAEKRALRQEAATLRDRRRIIRQQRQHQDAAWQMVRQQQRVELAPQAHAPHCWTLTAR
jgi:hypothetical protein